VPLFYGNFWFKPMEMDDGNFLGHKYMDLLFFKRPKSLFSSHLKINIPGDETMRKILFALIILMLAAPALALTDYQQGALDGLKRGWFMAEKYAEANAGDPAAYNEAVAKYNEWIVSVFGQNESLMLKPINAASRASPYFSEQTIKPVHAIDSSWNQTLSPMPAPDASGRIGGVPAESYYSIGPALSNF
jgi:hypothetical protein